MPLPHNLGPEYEPGSGAAVFGLPRDGRWDLNGRAAGPAGHPDIPSATDTNQADQGLIRTDPQEAWSGLHQRPIPQTTPVAA